MGLTGFLSFKAGVSPPDGVPLNVYPKERGKTIAIFGYLVVHPLQGACDLAFEAPVQWPQPRGYVCIIHESLVFQMWCGTTYSICNGSSRSGYTQGLYD